MTPKLSSYWLYFITSTTYSLAVNLVDSMKIDVIARQNSLASDLGIHLFSYKEAINMAFDKIKQNDVLAVGMTSFTSEFHKRNVWQYLEVQERLFTDFRIMKVDNEEWRWKEFSVLVVKQAGVDANFLWKIRGFLQIN